MQRDNLDIQYHPWQYKYWGHYRIEKLATEVVLLENYHY